MQDWNDVVQAGTRLARVEVTTGNPGAFFITPHYHEVPYMVVRLEAVDPVELAELVEDAWRTQAPKRLVAQHDRDSG